MVGFEADLTFKIRNRCARVKFVVVAEISFHLNDCGLGGDVTTIPITIQSPSWPNTNDDGTFCRWDFFRLLSHTTTVVHLEYLDLGLHESLLVINCSL